MIHMGIDQRCVMATFKINTPKRVAIARQKKGKLGTTKHEGRDQTDRNIGVEKPELGKKDTRRSLKKIKEKAGAANKEMSHLREKKAETKKAAAQAKSKNAEAQAQMRMQKRKQKKPMERPQKSW